jgi:Hsp70 protein/DnaJ C terminal domain
MPASINGFGTTYYGSCDFHSDGSYITTEWIIAVHIPILPLASFRVLPDGSGQNYLVFNSQRFTVQKVPLCLQQVRNTYLTILIVIISIILLGILAFINGILALVYLVFLLSVLIFRGTYWSWCLKIVRMTRSRNQYGRHSEKKQSSDARNDLDLTLELSLSLEEMCIGTKKQVLIDGGTIDVEVPAGISPGKRLCIRGKGKFEHDSSERGDLYLEIVTRVDSSFHSQYEHQGTELKNLKVGEGTSSVLSIVLRDDSLLVGIIRDGYTSILPSREDAPKIPDLFAFTENGDEFIDKTAVTLHFQQLIKDVSKYFDIELSNIIIAVPCWFDIPQYNALKRLAVTANLRLLRCYPSPVLASIGCKFNSRIFQKIVIFEISHSSLSVAILDVDDGIFEVIGTDGKIINPDQVEHLCRISLMKLLDDAQLTKNQIDEIILLGDLSNATK